MWGPQLDPSRTLFWPLYHLMSLSRYNQVNAISMACSTGVEGCKELTSGWFRDWMNNSTANTCVHTPRFPFILSISFPYSLHFTLLTYPSSCSPHFHPRYYCQFFPDLLNATVVFLINHFPLELPDSFPCRCCHNCLSPLSIVPE